MTTLGLKNVNLLSKERYDGIAEPVKDELWTVEVETYSDEDGNWYRVYPDGWCEQGGIFYSAPSTASYTINLLKPFKDTSYTVLGCVFPGVASNYHMTHQGSSINVKNTTSFTKEIGSGSNYQWVAKGYIA